MARSVPPGKGNPAGKKRTQRPRAPEELKRAFEKYVQATQGNFDHLDGQAREFARQFNLLAQDIEVLYESLGIDPEEEISFGDSVGVDGDPGIDGLDGEDGLPGLDGIQGKDGKDGIPGLDGPQGPPGRDQPPGIDGMPGERGAPGIDGLDGGPGRDGTPGTVGPMGPDGLDGPPGPVWTPAAPEDNTLGIFRRDDGNNAQIEGVWLIDADPPTEETDLTGGNNFTLEFALGAGDGATSDVQGQTGWVLTGPWNDPDYWGVTHAPNTVLELEEGVYAYQMALIFDGAAAVNLNEVFGGFDYAEDPTTISPFATWSSGPNYTVMQTGGDPNIRTTWLFTGVFVVPTGGAHYVFAFSAPTLGGTELRGYQLLLTKAQGAGATGDTGATGATGPQGPQAPDGIDSATGAPVFKTLVYNSANTADDGDQPADYAAFNYQIQRVWGVSEVARSNPITVDLEVNGVSVGWPVASPTVPAAGGVGTERAPTSARVAKGDKVVVVFSGTGGEEGRAQVKLRVVAT